MRNIVVGVLTLMTFSAFCQNQASNSAKGLNAGSRPKLVVGIVVDQMRWDYLYRYADKYGTTGFKRLQKGYNCENTHIPYVPAYTAPGHTCIYTGSVPALHGIIGNDWYSREAKAKVYCTSDTNYMTLGAGGNAGRMSPHNMMTTTITDELRLASNFHSKVIGIAIKDRSAILPAGHAANGAYWWDGNSGNWISSSYYGDSLPAWVNTFNALKEPDRYLKDNWNTIRNIATYTESSEDDNAYENPFPKEGSPTFPHKISEMTGKNVDVLRSTPWGNSLTFDFAEAAIKGEYLGMSRYTDNTDFLAVSFSSTDFIGHQFGPNSVEVEDCYIRFDRDLGDFLSWLDKTVGAGDYLVFLTADHGASHAQGFNRDHHLPGGVVTNDTLWKMSNAFLKTKYGKDSLVDMLYDMQIYLSDDRIIASGLDKDNVRKELMAYLITVPGVARALDLTRLKTTTLPSSYLEMFINGYYQKRSGDIQFILDPAYMEGFMKGATHGTAYAYDTHIPLLWYGWGVKSGYDYSQTYMTDIAPTLAALLHIQEPDGSIGKPVLLMK